MQLKFRKMFNFFIFHIRGVVTAARIFYELTHEFEGKTHMRTEIRNMMLDVKTNFNYSQFAVSEFSCLVTMESLSSALNNSTAEIRWIFSRQRAVVVWNVNFVGLINILRGSGSSIWCMSAVESGKVFVPFTDRFALIKAQWRAFNFNLSSHIDLHVPHDTMSRAIRMFCGNQRENWARKF